MPQHILLAGFEPFDGETVNPSWEAVKALDRVEIAPGYRISSRELPCAFGKALVALRQELAALNPILVVAVGQAGGRADITLERIAINLDDAPIPDNAGQQPTDTAVVDNGPPAYFSTLPIKAIMLALRERGVPASISNTAGTFVCNHVFYGLMHALRNQVPAVRGGFVHIPYLPEQAARFQGAPSMSSDQVRAALQLIVQIAMGVSVDLRLYAGALN